MVGRGAGGGLSLGLCATSVPQTPPPARPTHMRRPPPRATMGAVAAIAAAA
eukprot:SAG31_NODE_2899_length_4933_cov_2.793795_6_plen_50_part_01